MTLCIFEHLFYIISLVICLLVLKVLEDIHRQSVSDSQTTRLSLGYLPAPDAIVESIPLKIFYKVENESPPQ